MTNHIRKIAAGSALLQRSALVDVRIAPWGDTAQFVSLAEHCSFRRDLSAPVWQVEHGTLWLCAVTDKQHHCCSRLDEAVPYAGIFST